MINTVSESAHSTPFRYDMGIRVMRSKPMIVSESLHIKQPAI